MYIRPTLPAAGVLWPTQALIHSIALASGPIGSGPGVAGLSGMHVKPLVPLRRTRILPSASIATMVAFFPTAAGAALMALLISSASVGAAFSAVGAALAAAFGASAFASIARLRAAKPSSSIPEVILVCIAILPLVFILDHQPRVADIHRQGMSRFVKMRAGAPRNAGHRRDKLKFQVPARRDKPSTFAAEFHSIDRRT